MSTSITTEGPDDGNEGFRVENGNLEVPSLAAHMRRQGFEFGDNATVQFDEPQDGGSEEDMLDTESDGQLDELPEDDPELNFLRDLQANEEAGQIVGDDTLSPKGMDNAEVLAGLRDPD